ncbi:hypothetical protein DVH24_031474 [Malus domestica]|uniref:Uncharacterized protein n=1 Tax=Malus domestica TaxID=3750 RepID=A0A498HJ27_MALDO|nr:hypothetical protein DVH24_031474 [Malus domestica]
MMGDPLGSSFVSSQKQNCEGVVEARNGQYRATVESSSRCGGGLGRDPLPHSRLDSAVARYCPLWASTTTSQFCFRELTQELPSGSPIMGLFSHSLNFGVPMEPKTSELLKGLMLGRDENIHIRLRGSTPLGDVGCYNPPTLGARPSSCESNPRMGDPLGSSRVSSQKQNREGVVEAQSGQYRATMESSSGCGGGQAGM